MMGFTHTWGKHRVFFRQPGDQRIYSVPAGWSDVEGPDAFGAAPLPSRRTNIVSRIDGARTSGGWRRPARLLTLVYEGVRDGHIRCLAEDQS